MPSGLIMFFASLQICISQFLWVRESEFLVDSCVFHSRSVRQAMVGTVKDMSTKRQSIAEAMASIPSIACPFVCGRTILGEPLPPYAFQWILAQLWLLINQGTYNTERPRRWNKKSKRARKNKMKKGWTPRIWKREVGCCTRARRGWKNWRSNQRRSRQGEEFPLEEVAETIVNDPPTPEQVQRVTGRPPVVYLVGSSIYVTMY
ncbi:uncharacterized protein EI90DRAFT_3032766 [Cantharellus anzutake]|uniref:uncharacterized protein n=1 Tax=Cantharellus anzutake TaxID=1750568 RepID=UPI0019058510|nr:uncharacterized protein EI90DRAFT_3032766 [Cantharellus anzutake]KAF8342286.1 hypothetical protein EI90DRAFT_3032766 [Cantharellus anzutake]